MTLGPVVVILLLEADASAVINVVMSLVAGMAHLEPIQLI